MDKPSAKASAVSYLARREHSRLELEQKLAQKGYDAVEIDTALTQLKEKNLQSDQRFSDNFIHARSQKGYGIMRIKMELQQRGVDAVTIDNALEQADIDWFELAVQMRHKHFGEEIPKDYKDKAKQQRYLQYRGFTQDQIRESFNTE